MTADDIADYTVIEQAPTHIDYRGLDVYGMAPSSSGGTTVGESLNILENFDLSAANTPQSLHLYLEATAHAFADRNAYVGDPAFVDVPTETLLSQEFADARACVIDPDVASVKPVAARTARRGGLRRGSPPAEPADTENISTTHLSVVDQWGNAVAYTLTIEQTGGSGMTVPGRGFLLNNELTDFNFAAQRPTDPNTVEPGKRPRSSMSPTIVLDDGDVRYVVGSPGRVDDHHHRDAGADEPHRPRDDAARGRGGTACIAAEYGGRCGRAGVPHGVRSAAHAIRPRSSRPRPRSARWPPSKWTPTA